VCRFGRVEESNGLKLNKADADESVDRWGAPTDRRMSTPSVILPKMIKQISEV
jgi:hypothetical protein